MKAATQKVLARFALEMRYEVPIPAAPLRGAAEGEIERLKNRLLHQLLNEATDASLQRPLQKAAEEAASLAWLTPFPLLVLPLLLDEKARAAQLHAYRQARIRRRSQALLAKVT